MLLFGQLRMEWLGEWKHRQTCGNWQELEAHPDVWLNLKDMDPVLDCWREGSALSAVAVVGDEAVNTVRLS